MRAHVCAFVEKIVVNCVGLPVLSVNFPAGTRITILRSVRAGGEGPPTRHAPVAFPDRCRSAAFPEAGGGGGRPGDGAGAAGRARRRWRGRAVVACGRPRGAHRNVAWAVVPQRCVFDVMVSRVRGLVPCPNFERSVLGCIKADFCNYSLILQYFSGFTRWTRF